jgi:hypothetical protein
MADRKTTIPCSHCLNRTIEQRLHDVAIEMENLSQITQAEPWLNAILEHIEERKYKEARWRLSPDWEPSDPPGFEGGFANNH